MKNLNFYLLLTLIACSCNTPESKTPSSTVENGKAPMDALITSYVDSWNKHDSLGVSNLFDANALLSDDNFTGFNLGEISAKWIHPNIDIVNDLKAVKLQEWSTNDRAGYTGTYELNLVVKGAVVAKPRGVFTMNWLKTDKGDWKITTAHMHSFFEHK